MSIAPPVGAMSAYLSRLYSGRTYQSVRGIMKNLADRALRAEEYSRGFMVGGGTLLEELGFSMSDRSTVTTWTICCRF